MLALATPFFLQNLKGGGFALEGTAQTANEFGSERLKHQAVFLFHEGDLCPFADGVFTPQFCGNNQLAFCGDSGDFGFHRPISACTWHQKYAESQEVSQTK